MYKLILFTTSWLQGTDEYVQLVRKIAADENLDFNHYDSEVNSNQSLIQLFNIKTSPTLVLVNKESGDYKKYTMFHKEAELMEWITKIRRNYDL